MSLFQADKTIAKFTCIIMRDGKKATAVRILDDCFKILREKHEVRDPSAYLREAIDIAKPMVETRKYKVAGRALQIPIPCTPHRQQSLANRFIRDAFRTRKERSSSLRLANELVELHNRTGGAYSRRDEVHRRAELNRAFAHFAK